MEWISVKDRLPTKYGKYWVCRLKAKKQHPRVWNGSGWAYDAKEITHWAEYPELPSDENSDLSVISQESECERLLEAITRYVEIIRS